MHSSEAICKLVVRQSHPKVTGTALFNDEKILQF